MFVHNKRLQYTVRVAAPNPGLANLLLDLVRGAEGQSVTSRHFSHAPRSPELIRRDR